MNAWDGWLGSLVGTLVGAAIALAATSCFAKKAVREQEALVRRRAASDEAAQMCREISSLVSAPLRKDDWDQQIVLHSSLASSSVMRIRHLLGEGSKAFCDQLSDGIAQLSDEAVSAIRSGKDNLPALTQLSADAGKFMRAALKYLDSDTEKQAALQELVTLVGPSGGAGRAR